MKDLYVMHIFAINICQFTVQITAHYYMMSYIMTGVLKNIQHCVNLFDIWTHKHSWVLVSDNVTHEVFFSF
jgi:hypothetical protein